MSRKHAHMRNQAIFKHPGLEVIAKVVIPSSLLQGSCESFNRSLREVTCCHDQANRKPTGRLGSV